jgi:hypothetical protein
MDLAKSARVGEGDEMRGVGGLLAAGGFEHDQAGERDAVVVS